jgi:hypothetical protein
MNQQFTLPTDITSLTDHSLIEKVKNHLLKLSYQQRSLEFLEIFNKIPNLESFSFDLRSEYDDEGGYDNYIYLENYTLLDEFHNEEYIRNQLTQYLHHMLSEDEGEYFFSSLVQENITRDNIEPLVANIFEEGEFARWQETKKAIEEKAQLDSTVGATQDKSNSSGMKL